MIQLGRFCAKREWLCCTSIIYTSNYNGMLYLLRCVSAKKIRAFSREVGRFTGEYILV